MRRQNQTCATSTTATKWHRWTIAAWMQLVTLLSIDLTCIRLITTSVFGVLETCYLMTLGWDDFVVMYLRP